MDQRPAGQAGRAVADRARALLAAVRALEEPRGPPAATADPAKPGTHGAAKAAHTVVDALRALEPAALRKPKALGSAVGKGLAAQKADAPASDLGQAIGAALKALGKGWRRAGDLAKAVSQAVVAFGGKLATNAADGARAAGAALRETAPAALATAKGAAKIVAQTLRPASSAWRHRAEDVGVAVGAALAETRQKWLTDGVGVGTAVGGALKGVRAPVLRAVAARAKAVGVAVAEAGDSLFANAASAGAAVGAALKVVLGRGRSRGAQLAEATGIAIAELSTRAAIKARGVLESAREVGEALGGALRLGLGAAAKSPRVFERALVGAIASFKKAQPGPVADSKVTLLVAGLRTWRPGDRGAVLTSFANTANLLLGQHDNERDGAVRRHPYRGPGRKEARWDLSYGNGVLNTPEDRTRNRGALQKLAHQDVTQIVNRTDGVRDLVSCIREVNAGKRSPPSDAIADLVVQHVREARPMKHVAHSENTLQTALGLERARRLLIAGAGGATPMSAEEAEVAIRRWVRVAGVGPAIGRHHTLIEGLLNLVFAKTAGKVERAVLDVSGAKDDSFTLQLEIPTWFAGNDPAGRAYWQNFAHPEDPISMAVGEGGLGKVDLAHHDFQEYANPSTPLGHALGRWVDTDHWTERAPVSPASP